MARVKRGVMHSKRRRNLLKRTKGMRWGHKNLIKRAKVAAWRAGAYSYRDRRTKKREARKGWTMQLNAATRAHGMSYSTFIGHLKKSKVELDRKVLSQIANQYPMVLKAIVEEVK
ncbi:50S ribosomal protein L20 [Candidatus Uhrbacteria bacterium]|nr:50S ribosomal protein L20 [Candidatus Uhrbacteria bacterium]